VLARQVSAICLGCYGNLEFGLASRRNRVPSTYTNATYWLLITMRRRWFVVNHCGSARFDVCHRRRLLLPNKLQSLRTGLFHGEVSLRLVHR
jgi:hypothetical protein